MSGRLRRALRSPARIPLAVLATLLGVYTFRFGYAYGSGDHDELIPSVLALLDGRLFTRDWLIQAVLTGVNVRTAFVVALAVAGKLAPLAVAVAGLHALVWSATAAGVYALGWELTRSRLAAALGTTLALVVAPTWAIGSNALVAPAVLPESVAWALALPALVLWLRGRWVAAGVLLGLAAWVHLLVGGLVGLWLGLVLLRRSVDARDTVRIRDAVRFGLAAVGTALPILVPVALDQATQHADPSGPSPLWVHAVFRNPWHHLFFSFAPGQQVRFWGMMALGVAALVGLRRRGGVHHASSIVRLWLVAAALGAVAVAFVEVWPVETVAKVQFFKLAVPSLLFAALLVGGVAASAVPTAWRTLAAAVWARAALPLGVLAVGLVALGIGMGVRGAGPYAGRLQPVTQPDTDLGRIETWARRETLDGALFVVPPSASTFRTYARRSVVITWNGFVFGDRAMQTWAERLLEVAPIDPPPRGADPRPDLDRAYAAQSPGDWIALASRYGADYAVVPDSLALPFPVAHHDRGWTVVRLPRFRVLPLAE